MDELIEAFEIFKKYTDKKYVTHCEHDELIVCVDPNEVSEEDIERLDEIGFIPHEEEVFLSYRYGSC